MDAVIDQAGPGRRALRLRALLLLLAGAAALGVHARRYAGFVSDDALISLRYAARLLEGAGLTWNDGERVEGYSNLLWVLATAGLGALGVDLVLAARLLAQLALVAAMAALLWLHWPRRTPEQLGALFGVVAMGLTGCFAVWAMGGLEQPLLAALVAWAYVLLACERADETRDRQTRTSRQHVAAGVLLGLACWTRPDAPIFAACAVIPVLEAGLTRRTAWRDAVWVVLPALLAVGLQLAFRLVYYGEWLPNPAHAKLAFTGHRLATGWAYWRDGMWPLAGLWLPAIGGFVLAWRRPAQRWRVLLFAGGTLAWSVWVIAVGGDIFPGRRHLVVVVPLLALLAAEFFTIAARAALAAGTAGAGLGAATLLTAGICLLLLGTSQWSGDREHLRALREVVWARQGESLGRALGSAFAEARPLVAVTAAGAIPYYSRLPALDMLGLNDRYLADHPPASLGQGRIAHELGDGDYFLRREPDIVIFCGTSGAARACSRGGREMQADPRFARDYELVTFLGDWPVEVHGKLWVRARSPRVGARVATSGGRTERIEIPGMLLAHAPGAVAGRTADGTPGALIWRDAPAIRRRLPLEPGRWRATVEATAPTRLRVLDADAPRRGAALASGAAPFSFELEGPGRSVDLMVSTLAEQAHVARVVLSREDTDDDATASDAAAASTPSARRHPAGAPARGASP